MADGASKTGNPSPRRATASPKSPPGGPSGSTPASPPASALGPITGTGHLEVDLDLIGEDEDEDGDSAMGSRGGLSDTTSVMSSVFRFREENGRTYHAYRAEEAAYFMPNDERENERLDLQHHMCVRMQDNRLYVCPAGSDRPLTRVLDLGTGTGIWVVDFADEHPEVSVAGVDLSPIQPDCVPPNAEFFIDDVESEWNYHTKFDFIYGRMLTGSIRDWPKLMTQAFDNLNPGGYIEICDSLSPLKSDDGTLKEDSALLRWNQLLVQASDKLGPSLESAHHYESQLKEAGFEDVTKIEFKWPLNSWPRDARYKELGEWNYFNVLQGMQAVSLMLFTNVLGWTVAEVEVLLTQVRKEAKNRDIHAYWPVYVVYGRKPE
jgi:SAM-dependent methyltransferase